MSGRSLMRWWWFSSLPAGLVLIACSSAAKPSAAMSAGTAPAPVAAAVATPAPTTGRASGSVAVVTPAEPAAVTIDVTQMRFKPETVRIKAGESVTWTFDDGDVPHTATAFDRSFDSGVLRSGSFTLRFDTPGAYCYQCVLHPGLNLCGQTALPDPAEVQLHLTGDGLTAAGGGGHMQGKIVVEP